MTEVIINYPSKAALVQLATALGYYDTTAKQIIAQATIDAGGSYFFNYVGPVVATPVVYDNARPPNVVTPAVMAPGLWARLRHNADPQRLQDKITQSASAAASLGITIYKRALINGQMAWTSDGVNAGPDYLDTVGVVA